MTLLKSLEEQYPHISFGTSGVRSLVADLRPDAVSAYVCAFMQRMEEAGGVSAETVVAVGMDLRPSSPVIASAVCHALTKTGYRLEFLGALPTPALALRCLSGHAPGIMVTGSHIPFDRNGIKFYGSEGEILKSDEQAIAACQVRADWVEDLSAAFALPEVNPVAIQAYTERYVQYFGPQSLSGLRVGVYEHSAVGRDLTKAILHQLGATVVSVGRSDEFVPIDTEAVSDADLNLAAAWCAEHRLDALVSTDGDGDRPLVFDEKGQFVRGDVLGLLCAKYLGLRALAVPVSCSSAIERTRAFKCVVRTRIGSPYVVAAMNDLIGRGETLVGGFEANGGFLLGSDIPGLSSLPTRDALLPIVCALCAAAGQQTSLDTMVEVLPHRYTYSDRIKDVPMEYSRNLLERMSSDSSYRNSLFPEKPIIVNVDNTDGLRLTFEDEDIVHIRPSGNAPELRCYSEAGSVENARALCMVVLGRIISERKK